MVSVQDSVIHALELWREFGKRKKNTLTLSESLVITRVHGSRYPARKTIRIPLLRQVSCVMQSKLVLFRTSVLELWM